MKTHTFYAALAALCVAATAVFIPDNFAVAAYHFSDFDGRPPIHVFRAAASVPKGLTPAVIKKFYNLPAGGGGGTIAIIDTYDDPTIESDLGVFNKQYGLWPCTMKNGCLIKHRMTSSMAANSGWALETSLDVEWAYAIAPGARILLVEAETASDAHLLDAVDYARKQKGIVAISMSWGGVEFSDEAMYDAHFAVTTSGPVFFASSGDDGAGVSWPAASPNVVGVGGTSVLFATSTGKFIRETAWTGSGGGVSVYEAQPAYQKDYNIPRAKNMRAIPDVAYNADPASGYSVYKTTGKAGGAWYVVGGTSAGAPQWAAIHALGQSVGLGRLYADKASSGTLKYFRDITSGSNGTCAYYCDARKRYDYVTGLGTPQTVHF